MHRFDFEEAKLNNYEDLPMYWFAIGRTALTTDRNFTRQPLHQELVSRPGFPGYTKVGFDRPQRQPGNHRLHLGLNGGNVGAFVEVGVLPAVPMSDYLITTTVSTSSLKHARARIMVYFVDERGRRIEGSIQSSELIQTDGRSQVLKTRLRGEFPNAAWIGMQAELLQPQEQSLPDRERHQVLYEEVEGDAWFDNINIWQLPHIKILSSNPVNVIRHPDRPVLELQVRDLTSRPLSANVVIYDHRLREVDRNHREINEWAPAAWKWQPKIDRFGWYLVDLFVKELGNTNPPTKPVGIARTMLSVLWLPNESVMVAEDANRFRVVAEDASQAEADLMPMLLEKTRLSSLVMSAWTQGTTLEGLDQQQKYLADLTQTIANRGQDVVLSFNPVPEQLAQNQDVDPRNPAKIFKKNVGTWEAYAMPVLMRHGQRVHRWQLGTTDYPVLYYQDNLHGTIRSIVTAFRNMTPHPRLVLPWQLDQPYIPGLEGDLAFAISVPRWVMAQHIGQYTKPWKQSSSTEFWLHLQEPPATQMSHARRIEDLALRMLHAWEIEPTGLAIRRPWAFFGNRMQSLSPDPLLGVFSAVAHRLAGRRVISRLPLGEGLECMILNGPSGGALAAWNKSAPPSKTTVEMFLGSTPQAVDVWGNRTNIPLKGQRHRFTLGTTPIFIEGINPGLAMLRASFKVIPPFIESLAKTHQRLIRFINPWPLTINGQMRIIGPKKWDIQPRAYHFSLAGGQSAVFPVEMIFPVTETTGIKRLVARFDFVAGSEHYSVDLSTPMELGLANIDFDATVELMANPDTGKNEDVVVTQMITNKGDKKIALYTFSNLRGFPRQERIIAQLAPGQLVVRRFLFRGGVQMLRQYGVRVGVRESIGPAVLNMVLTGEGEGGP